MSTFRLLLAAIFTVVTVYTLNVGTIHGWGPYTIFFGEDGDSAR